MEGRFALLCFRSKEEGGPREDLYHEIYHDTDGNPSESHLFDYKTWQKYILLTVLNIIIIALWENIHKKCSKLILQM